MRPCLLWVRACLLWVTGRGGTWHGCTYRGCTYHGPTTTHGYTFPAIHATAMLLTAAWVDDDGLCGDGQEEHGEELEHDLDAEEGEGEERGEGLVRLALLHAHLRRVQLRAVREVLVGVVQVGGTRVGEAVRVRVRVRVRVGVPDTPLAKVHSALVLAPCIYYIHVHTWPCATQMKPAAKPPTMPPTSATASSSPGMPGGMSRLTGKASTKIE